jgi:hypothetical protein
MLNQIKILNLANCASSIPTAAANEATQPRQLLQQTEAGAGGVLYRWRAGATAVWEVLNLLSY